jgi:UDP-N-acetylmuramyl tripeptide synthase
LFGKGDESTQELNGVYLPFSDKEVAKKILRSLG